jgi:lipoprotein-anchoring transpeptidase ErfK/SrfK
MRAARYVLASLAWACLCGSNIAQPAVDLALAAPSHKQVLADFLMEYMRARYPVVPSEGCVLYVSVKQQRMYYVVDQEMMAEYVISTSKNGLGGMRNSERTPEGLHRIVQKIGAGVPPYGIFRWRHFTGAVADSNAERDDLITSRILRLDGLEPGVNEGGAKDSMERGIYIHGTADEASLGRPSSHGCIRMRNSDVIRLFDRVPLGTLVVILDN